MLKPAQFLFCTASINRVVTANYRTAFRGDIGISARALAHPVARPVDGAGGLDVRESGRCSGRRSGWRERRR